MTWPGRKRRLSRLRKDPFPVLRRPRCPGGVLLRTRIRTCTIVDVHTVTYTALRKNLASAMDRVNDDRAPMIVTRQNGRPAVLMSLDDFQSYEETLYLMRNPRNSERLNHAIEELRRGEGRRRELVDDPEVR